LEAVPILFIGM